LQPGQRPSTSPVQPSTSAMVNFKKLSFSFSAIIEWHTEKCSRLFFFSKEPGRQFLQTRDFMAAAHAHTAMNKRAHGRLSLLLVLLLLPVGFAETVVLVDYPAVDTQSALCTGPWTPVSQVPNGCRGANDISGGCFSKTFSVAGRSVTRVSGRLMGFQKGTPDAFADPLGITRSGFDGVSISTTSGTLLWAYVFGVRDATVSACGNAIPSVCPSRGGASPAARFQNRWYCESGNPGCNWDVTIYPSRLLTNVPPFSVDFSDASSSFSDIVVSICTDEAYANEGVIFDYLQINVTYAPLAAPPTTATLVNYPMVDAFLCTPPWTPVPQVPNGCRGANDGAAGCYSKTFSVAAGRNITRVSGRLTAFQKGSTDAFAVFALDGVSISTTSGSLLWAYAVGIRDGVACGNDDASACPSRGGTSPAPRFQDRWYCESGFRGCNWDVNAIYPSRLFTNVPPFSVDLSDASSSFTGIVVSICTNQVYGDEGVIIDSLQINVTYAPIVCLLAVERKVVLPESGVEVCQPCPPGSFSPPSQPYACNSTLPLRFRFAESFADTFPGSNSNISVFAARVRERVGQVIGWPPEYVLNVSITPGSIVAAMGVPTNESWYR
jgi:hypothetical protein